MNGGLVLRGMRSFEAFLQIELTRKRWLGIVFLLLLLPRSGVLFLVLLFLAASLLPRDVHSHRMGMYLALPFTRTGLLFCSYGLGLFLILLGALISGALSDDALWPSKLVAMTIFFTSYFSISLISATAGRDTLTLPIMALFAEIIAGAALGVGHPFRAFSPFFQESVLFSALVALLLLVAAFTHYLIVGRRL
jgi:hypothetical protein